MGDKISVTVIATGFNKSSSAEKTPEIQKLEEQINSDTMSIDNFVKIGTRKPIETAEPKKNDLLSGIFGNDEIYEDDKAPVSGRTSQPASFMREPAQEEKKDFLSDFARATKAQPRPQAAEVPPRSYSDSYDPNDLSVPAAWRRNLEGLSRTINLGKK